MSGSGDETAGNLVKGKTNESSTNDFPIGSNGTRINDTLPSCAFRTIPSTGDGLGHRKDAPYIRPGAANGTPPVAPKAMAMKDTLTQQLKSKKPGARVQSVSLTAVPVPLAASLQSASVKKGPPVTSSKAKETAVARSGASRNDARTQPHAALLSAGTQKGIAAVGPKTSAAPTPKTKKTPLSAAESGPNQAGGTRRAPTSPVVSRPKPAGSQNASPRKQASKGASKTPVNSHIPKTNSVNGTPSGPIKVGSAKNSQRVPGSAKNSPRVPGSAKNSPRVPGSAKNSPRVLGSAKNSPKVAGVSSSSASNEPATSDGASNAPTRPGTSKRRSPRRRRRRTRTNGLNDEQTALGVGTAGTAVAQQLGSACCGGVLVGTAAGTSVVTRPQQPTVVSEKQSLEEEQLCLQMREACVVTRPQLQVVMNDDRLVDVYRQLREVEHHPEMIEGLRVMGPEDCGEIRVGMEMSVTFMIINDSEVNRELQSYGPVVLNPSIVARSSCPCPIPRLSDSTKVIVSMTGSSSQILHNYICFSFDGGTMLYHKIHLTVTSAIVEFLVPDGVYEPRRQLPDDYRTILENAVEGVKPPCPPPLIIPDTKKWHDVPKELRNSPTRFSFPYLEQPLTLDMYSTRFDVLLWLEELRSEREVRQYDMSSVSLFPEDEYLCLHVPGLTKRKKPVMVGDKLIFSTYKPEEPADVSDQSDQEHGAKNKNNKKRQLPFTRDGEHYSAYVHKIFLREEVLKVRFMSWFHESEELCHKKYEVMFTINRVTLMRMHDALDMAEVIGNQVLFPSTKPPPPSLECASQNLQFINPKLNPQQRRAVEAIVSGASRPIPYILFGPPGTGKTVTVVESILQIYERDSSSKILACAPSNSAADLLVERLSKHVDERSMVRLNAVMRSKELLQSIQKYYMVVNDTKVKDAVRRSRIIVCTCSTAAMLGLLEMTFSYVFVDEAGQALEPECLIPVSLLDERSGQLVLAGDPLQLGPVVFSSLASDNGLAVSMLERLMGRDPYKRNTAFAATGNYDSMVVTKLVENYRSHGMLLKLYSDQFYDGELVEKADRGMTHSLCNWEYLPTKGIPLLFHGKQGAEKRDRGSPSWFNAFEAEQVLDYAKKLVLQHSVRQLDVGIIAPYNKQVEKIKLLLDGEGLSDVKVGSVEEFQGREKRVIIISTVRSSSTFLLKDIRMQLGFVSSPKRFNVAISRAQALLIVVGNPHLLAQDPCWSKLIQYARDNHCYTGCSLLM